MPSDRVASAADSETTVPGHRPLLTRLVPHTVVSNIDAEKNQPRIGAYLEVRRYDDTVQTIWFPATVWSGITAIIRQTPDQCRADVVEFLRVLQSELGSADPRWALMQELCDEVAHDPYGEWPQSPPEAFDSAW